MQQDISDRILDNDTNTKVNLDLEEIVLLTNKIGLEYASEKHEADRLSLLKHTVQARIMLELDESYSNLSEAKKRRLMEASKKYVDFIEELLCAKKKYENLRIRYDSYKNLFEARRSMLSYKKAEMNLI